MGKKLDSLIKLSGLGFNTPIFETIEDVKDIHQYENQMKAWERVSIRSDLRDSKSKAYRLPFFPNLLPEQVDPIIKSIINDKVIVIISKGVDPDDNLVGGKYLINPVSELMELFLGPGTIRHKIEDSPGDLLHINLNGCLAFPFDSCPVGLLPFAQPLQKIRDQVKVIKPPFVIEFSINKKKVGKKHERVIFWELA